MQGRLGEGVGVSAHVGQHLRDEAILLLGQCCEQMLLLDGIIGILHSDALRSLQRLSCFLGKLIHIHSAYLLILQIPQNLIYMHERTLVPSSCVSFWSSLRWLLFISTLSVRLLIL